jgi:sensor histidine kinase YesM
MLVENAVEHGISGSKDLHGIVWIRSFEEDGFHVVEVEDNGAGIPLEKFEAPEEEQRLHVGLKNVEQRLERMCQGTLTIRSLEGKGTVAVIRIPSHSQPLKL